MSSRAVKQAMHTKTKKQVRYLLSSGSPLTVEQKKRLQRELHERKIRVRG